MSMQLQCDHLSLFIRDQCEPDGLRDKKVAQANSTKKYRLKNLDVIRHKEKMRKRAARKRAPLEVTSAFAPLLQNSFEMDDEAERSEVLFTIHPLSILPHSFCSILTYRDALLHLALTPF
jgi:hypothetical protein